MALSLTSITPSFFTFPSNPNKPKPPSSHPSTLHLFQSSNSTISLSPSTTIPRAFSQLSPKDPIFLPHLQEQEKEEQRQQIQEEIDSEPDPIIKFFKTQTLNPTQDTQKEGRTLLKRVQNKKGRSLWHLADFKKKENDTQEEVFEEEEEEEENEEVLDSGVSSLSSVGDGIVAEILQLARNLPENLTLGEVLGTSYAGKISENECVEILGLLFDEGLVISSLYFFEWMGIQEPWLVSPKAYNVMFTGLGSAGMGEKLMILFRNLPGHGEFKDARVYNSAIAGLLFCGRYDDAWKVYGEMETANLHPDHVTCSILITVMRKSGRTAKDAWEFFERMSIKGVKWSLEAVGALIKSFCDEGLKKEALIIQSDMEKKGISSNAIIYNTLIDAYAKDYQIEEAEGLFTEMKEKGIKPTAATYNILMNAYSRRMQPEIIEDLLLEMRDVGLEPNVKSYTCLISAYGRQKKMSDRAADAFLRMKKFGIKPTSHSYTALIHAYSVDRWPNKAYIAFENMRREGIKPAIETYTALLDAFRRAGDTEMLMQVWKLMRSEKVEETRVTFNTLLDGFAKQGNYVEARDVVSESVRVGHQQTVMTYNMLMNAYARGGQHSKLPQLLKEMAALNLKPDSFTYSTMIFAYIRVRDFRRAFYYHKQMVQSKQVPDIRTYQKLRSILDQKASIKNTKDRKAILGIVNSKMGLLKPKKGKKDEFWKNRKR